MTCPCCEARARCIMYRLSKNSDDDSSGEEITACAKCFWTKTHVGDSFESNPTSFVTFFNFGAYAILFLSPEEFKQMPVEVKREGLIPMRDWVIEMSRAGSDFTGPPSE